jgi:hypothetical protein
VPEDGGKMNREPVTVLRGFPKKKVYVPFPAKKELL